MSGTPSGLAVDRDHFIAGGWYRSAEGERREVRNPTDESVVATVAEGSEAEVHAALSAAESAFPAWARTPPASRATHMQRVADGIRRRHEEFAQLVVAEQGKPINEARGEVDGAAEFFSYYAGMARQIEGEILPSDEPGEEIWIRRVPRGVVVAIIPWNYPAALTSRKVAPAILAGNTIVLKPHEDTPLSALAIMEVIAEADIPGGVVNCVTGSGESVGRALVGDARTQFVSMTGSVAAGRDILENAAQHIVPVSLELGGKAPFIVMDDADLDTAVRSAVTSRYMNCGQVCICNERTYVHRSVYEQFLDRYIAQVEQLRVGDPTDEHTDVGPKVNREERDKVAEMVARAEQQGARIRTGGGVLSDGSFARGYWYAPTVLTDVDQSMDIMQREIFGPVTPVMPFDSFDEVIDFANDSVYGLSAYLFSNDFGRVMRAVNDIRFGEIYVNRIGPEAVNAFHVGYRHSGIGGDDGKYGLDLYLQPQTVYANFSGEPMDHLMPYGGT